MPGAGAVSHRTQLKEFAWDSAIGGGAGKFERTGATRSFGIGVERLCEGNNLALAAEEIHSVSVEQGVRAAWLVTEGRPDPAYKAFAYSLTDLTFFTSAGLYSPMTRAQADELIAWATA